MYKELSKSEKAVVEGLLRGIATTLGFAETRKGLYSLTVDKDTTAFIDFRDTWKGWRYAFKGNKALNDEEIKKIEPLRRFKELRDRIISKEPDVEGNQSMKAESWKSLVLPVGEVSEVSNSLGILGQVKSLLLDTDDYIYLDEAGNTVSKDKAVARRLRRSGLRKLAYAYGLNFHISGMEKYAKEGENGRYIWICRALVIEPRSGRKVEALGACSSGDAFFQRPPSEADVILRAQTMAVGRGIADLLGLGGVEALKSVEMIKNNKGRKST